MVNCPIRSSKTRSVDRNIIRMWINVETVSHISIISYYVINANIITCKFPASSMFSSAAQGDAGGTPWGPGALSCFRGKLHPPSQAWPLLSTSNRGEIAIAKCGNKYALWALVMQVIIKVMPVLYTPNRGCVLIILDVVGWIFWQSAD